MAGAAAFGWAVDRDLHSQALAAAADTAIALRNVAASKNLLFGGATSTNELEKDPEFAALFAQQCGILVPTGEIQWKSTQPKPDQSADFSAPDRLYAFARAHNMAMRGHALIYDQMTPAWFNGSVENPRTVMEKHIREKAAHFKGRLHSWDVVNEVINPNSSRKDGLVENVFLKLCGDDYIERAFTISAEADPATLRVFSDAASEGGGDFLTRKRALTLDYLNRLVSKKIPVQYIGIHGHLHTNFDANAFDTFLSDCTSLGLKIMVTELDVFDTNMPANQTARDEQVAALTKAFLDVALSHKETKAILCWGLADRYSWVAKFAPRPDGLPVRSLPFDAELKPKPMVSAIAAAIKNAPRRS